MLRKHAIIAILCLASAAVCHLPTVFADENLPDPTRPPAELAAPSPSPAKGGSSPETASAAPSLLLQSVLISSDRKSAIIDGQVVVLGGMHGESRVVKITESEVVLKKGAVKETLRLFPDVEKRSTLVRKK